MVAHVEEAHALLDEFEVDGESKSVGENPPLRSKYGRSSLPLVKIPFSRRLRASLITIVLIVALGLVTTLYTKRTRPSHNGEPEQLAYLLHPHEHSSRPPTTLVFNWTITSGLRSPDGVEKQVYLVNGESTSWRPWFCLIPASRSLSGALDRSQIWRHDYSPCQKWPRG